MRGNCRCFGDFHYIVKGAIGNVRNIDHDAQAVHFRNYLFSKRAQAVPLALRIVRASPKPPLKALRIVRQRQSPDPGLERRVEQLEANEQKHDQQIGALGRQVGVIHGELTIVRQQVLGDGPDEQD